jgi:mRNA-degrading endonuclease toxin of MazEF toxin-antitoxin module
MVSGAQETPGAAAMAGVGTLTPFRGEIWWVIADGRTQKDAAQGAQAAARRPVLVIQNDVGNARARTIIAAAVSRVVVEK